MPSNEIYRPPEEQVWGWNEELGLYIVKSAIPCSHWGRHANQAGDCTSLEFKAQVWAGDKNFIVINV